MVAIQELGEDEVLRQVLSQLHASAFALVGPGDDAAVLRTDAHTVMTSDTMFAGRDFRLDWHTPAELGWKIVAVNLADVAAMGATPSALTLSLGVPGSTDLDWIIELARGANRACQSLSHGCGIVGGDLANANEVSLSMTALGTLGNGSPVTRGEAKAEQVLGYAGDLGLSGLGLQLLESERSIDALRGSAHPAIAAHLTPNPPVVLGPIAARAGARAMLDVSDGLVRDARRIARASKCGVTLNSARLMATYGQQQGISVPLEHMLHGGEDHGLLAVFDNRRQMPPGFVEIGETVAEPRGEVTLDGEHLGNSGWDALRIEQHEG